MTEFRTGYAYDFYSMSELIRNIPPDGFDWSRPFQITLTKDQNNNVVIKIEK